MIGGKNDALEHIFKNDSILGCFEGKMSSATSSKLIEQFISSIMADPEQKKILMESIAKHNKAQATNWSVETKPKTHLIGVRDLISRAQKLCDDYDDGNPFSEDIFLIQLPKQHYDEDIDMEDLKQELEDLPWCDNAVVSGSSVVKILAKHLKRVNPNVAEKFSETATDIDIFKFKQSTIGISKIFFNDSQNVDLVSTTLDCVEDLLMGFDLPCCRAALEAHPDFLQLYVSRQCLKSLLTGKMTLPGYMKDLIPGSFGDARLATVFTRFNSRLKKYNDRGINTVYAETQDNWPWFSKGFMYTESGILKLNIKKIDKGFKIQ